MFKASNFITLLVLFFLATNHIVFLSSFLVAIFFLSFAEFQDYLSLYLATVRQLKWSED